MFIAKLTPINSPLSRLGFISVLFSLSLKQKSFNYLIYNVVDEIFTFKIMIALAKQ